VRIGDVEVDGEAGLAYVEATVRESGSVLEAGEVLKRYENTVTVEYMLRRGTDGAWKFALARTVAMLA
jgi:hypothetical protein